jgi:hypothetical protein
MCKMIEYVNMTYCKSKITKVLLIKSCTSGRGRTFRDSHRGRDFRIPAFFAHAVPLEPRWLQIVLGDLAASTPLYAPVPQAPTTRRSAPMRSRCANVSPPEASSIMDLSSPDDHAPLLAPAYRTCSSHVATTPKSDRLPQNRLIA